MKDIFAGRQITLGELLEYRERKATAYNRILENFPCVLCLSVNIPGPVKKNSASELFFEEGKRMIEEEFSGKTEVYNSNCGDFCLLGIQEDPFFVKKRTVKLESAFNWCRMLDIDVITKEGPIERSILQLPPRTCFVCGNNAKTCSSQASHSKEEICSEIEKFFCGCLSMKIGRICHQALLKEAHCTPKPGLVDEKNNGSHKDMNIELFDKSADCLAGYFVECSLFGLQGKTFSELRQLGLSAEKIMFNTTGGINTHQGAIFSLGLLSYACGKTLSCNPVEICAEIRNLTQDLVKEKNSGARKYAAEGFSVVTDYSLPLYMELKKKYDENKALCLTLLGLISKVEDSNILRRSNNITLEEARNKAIETLKSVKETGDFSPVEQLDSWFISKNISPGGSADLLALTYALSEII